MSNPTQETKTWALILHLSQFATYIVPVAGIIAPIVIWQIKKAEMPELDVHGKIVANWLISGLIYAVAGGILTFVLIGVPVLIALSVCAIAFPIIGAIKANNGEAWPYPLTIPFIK